MKFAIVSLLSVSALGQSVATLYGKCNVGDRAELHGKSFDIVSALTASTIKASGKLTIIDGCSFRVDEFTFVNGQQSQWFASNQGNPNAITLSDNMVQVSTNPSQAVFPLRQVAGAEANFRNVGEIRLFTPSTNTVIATVNLGGAPTTGPVTQNPVITQGTPIISMTSSLVNPMTSAPPTPTIPAITNGAQAYFGWTVGTILAALGIAAF